MSFSPRDALISHLLRFSLHHQVMSISSRRSDARRRSSIPSVRSMEDEDPILVPSERRSAEEVYSEFGGVDIEHVGEAFEWLGVPSVPMELLQRFWDSLPTKTRFLSRRQFLALLVICKKHYLEYSQAELPPAEKEAVCAFSAIGGNSDRTGYLEQDQLKQLCHNFGLGIDLDEFMAEVDEDGSGQVEYGEFMQLLRYDGASAEMTSVFEKIGATKSSHSATPQMSMERFLKLVPVPTSILIELAIEGDETISVNTFCDVVRRWGKSASEVLQIADDHQEAVDDDEDAILDLEASSFNAEKRRADMPPLDHHYSRRMSRKLDRAVEQKKSFTESRSSRPEAHALIRKPRKPTKAPHVLAPRERRLRNEERSAGNGSRVVPKAKAKDDPPPLKPKHIPPPIIEYDTRTFMRPIQRPVRRRTDPPMAQTPVVLPSINPYLSDRRTLSPKGQEPLEGSAVSLQRTERVPISPVKFQDLAALDAPHGTPTPESKAAAAIQRQFRIWRAKAIQRFRVATSLLCAVARGMLSRHRIFRRYRRAAVKKLQRIGRAMLGRITAAEKGQFGYQISALNAFLSEHTHLVAVGNTRTFKEPEPEFEDVDVLNYSTSSHESRYSISRKSSVSRSLQTSVRSRSAATAPSGETSILAQSQSQSKSGTTTGSRSDGIKSVKAREEFSPPHPVESEASRRIMDDDEDAVEADEQRPAPIPDINFRPPSSAGRRDSVAGWSTRDPAPADDNTDDSEMAGSQLPSGSFGKTLDVDRAVKKRKKRVFRTPSHSSKSSTESTTPRSGSTRSHMMLSTASLLDDITLSDDSNAWPKNTSSCATQTELREENISTEVVQPSAVPKKISDQQRFVADVAVQNSPIETEVLGAEASPLSHSQTHSFSESPEKVCPSTEIVPDSTANDAPVPSLVTSSVLLEVVSIECGLETADVEIVDGDNNDVLYFAPWAAWTQRDASFDIRTVPTQQRPTCIVMRIVEGEHRRCVCQAMIMHQVLVIPYASQFRLLLTSTEDDHDVVGQITVSVHPPAVDRLRVRPPSRPASASKSRRGRDLAVTKAKPAERQRSTEEERKRLHDKRIRRRDQAIAAAARRKAEDEALKRNSDVDRLEAQKVGDAIRPQLRRVYDRYTVDDCMDFSALQRFIAEVQRETDASAGHVQSLLHNFSSNGERTLTYSDFCRLLFDPVSNSVIHPQHREVYQDMTQPLQHYFIASSHNTYLSGDQVSSSSQVEMYRKALRSGCRCVEIDCWDGPKGRPVVYHGYTRTSKIDFDDVIDAIQETAFEASPFPVILSLEVHCSREQRKYMAGKITTSFGSSLYTIADHQKQPHELTPEGLQNRILVKWKANGAYSVLEAKDEDGQPSEGKQSDAMEESFNPSTTSRQDPLCSTVMLASIHSTDWGSTAEPYQVMSLVEGKVEEWSQPATFPNFQAMTSRMLIRVYPAGWRIQSGNYDPNLAWESGCQMVALNYQTFDEGLRINLQRFLSNGSCGYLLKPEYLRSPTSPAPSHPQRLRLNVVAAVHLGDADARKSLYLTAQIRGTRKDTSDNALARTKATSGLNLAWDEVFDFQVTHAELATVILRLRCDNFFSDDDLYEAIIPVISIREGYRCVPMNNLRQLQPSYSRAQHGPSVINALINFSGDVTTADHGLLLQSNVFTKSSDGEANSTGVAMVDEEATLEPQPLSAQLPSAAAPHEAETPTKPLEPKGDLVQAHAAATMVQKWWRGCLGREEFDRRWDMLWALEMYRLIEEESYLDE